MKDKWIKDHQYAVLGALAGKIDDFYLAGGTALSLFYFQHRISVDLDFFSQKINGKRVKEIVDCLKSALNKEIKLTGQNLKRDEIKMFVYNVYFRKGEVLKIDFVEDILNLVKKPKLVNGVHILSLEDIYIRKILAVSGSIKGLDKSGRAVFLGGRSDAKDYYDLYYLSHTFMPLSKFAGKYATPVMIEALIRWFRTYDRMSMMDGTLTLALGKNIDCKKIEKHFTAEIDLLIQDELGGI